MIEERLDWENYFIKLAFAASRRSTCPVRQVGCVLVNPDTNAVLSLGYNGAPRGTEHCGEACANRKHGENQDACKAVHSEANAIFNAARNGIPLDGCVAYLTLSPCLKCSQSLIQVGATQVVYANPSAYTEPFNLLSEAKVHHRTFIMQGPWWDGDEDIEYGV